MAKEHSCHAGDNSHCRLSRKGSQSKSHPASLWAISPSGRPAVRSAASASGLVPFIRAIVVIVGRDGSVRNVHASHPTTGGVSS